MEDDDGLRRQIVKILEAAPDIACVGACSSAEDALPLIAGKRPDVVLMDINLRGMSGIECVVEIKKLFPEIQVIMVTVFEDSERIFSALKAGASGYLIKSDSQKLLAEAIRDVYQGGAPMSSCIARKVVRHFYPAGFSSLESSRLSNREREVLDLLTQGLIYKEVGDKLNISEVTVRSHVVNICSKMHVRNKIEAVVKYHTKYA